MQALHNAGVVHRDVKPLNLILSEGERRFKLIDLGAAADLRNGTNYAPDESILDPSYCPPEQYCLPTTGPHLGRQLAPLKLAISPLLWSRHKPDCFDSYSTGAHQGPEDARWSAWWLWACRESSSCRKCDACHSSRTSDVTHGHSFWSATLLQQPANCVILCITAWLCMCAG